MTLQGLTGLTGIAGQQVLYEEQSQATPEERYGGTVDPRHTDDGVQTSPYPWQSKATQAAGWSGPYGADSQMLADEYWFFEPGGSENQDPTMDHTPTTHAAPWPKGIASGPVPGETPDQIAEQLRQSANIHRIDLNASAKMETTSLGWAQQDEWHEIDDTRPGHTDLQPIGRQAMSSGFLFGTRDRTQSFARQNEYGFDSSHVHRRYAQGPIPGNTMWMKPGGRPLVKHLAGPARPAIGESSPFAGQDLGQAFAIDGAYLQDQPTEYVAPPQPYLAPSQTYSGDDADVLWY